MSDKLNGNFGSGLVLGDFINAAQNNAEQNNTIMVNKKGKALITPDAKLAAKKDAGAFNAATNRLFLKALTSDPAYKNCANQIIEGVGPLLPEREPLTPLKVKTALSMAEQISTTKRFETIAHAVELLASSGGFDATVQSMMREHMFHHGPILDEHSSKEQVTQFLSSMLARPEILTLLTDQFLDASLVGGDEEKAGLAGKILLAGTGLSKQDLNSLAESIADYCFLRADPEGAPFMALKGLKNAFSYVGLSKLAAAGLPPETLSLLSKDDLTKLERSLSALPEGQRKQALEGVGAAITEFSYATSGVDARQRAEGLSSLTDDLADRIGDDPTTLAKVGRQSACKVLISIPDTFVSGGLDLFEELGVPKELAREALLTDEFLTQVSQKSNGALSFEALTRLLHSEAKSFLRGKEQLLAAPHVEAVKPQLQGEALVTLAHAQQALASLQGEGGVTQELLVQLKALGAGLLKLETGGENQEQIQALLSEFTADTDSAKALELCGRLRDQLSSLLGKLGTVKDHPENVSPQAAHNAAAQGVLQSASAQCIAGIKALYNALLSKLPPQEAAALQLKEDAAEISVPEKELILGMVQLKGLPVERKADEAAIGRALEQARANPEYSGRLVQIERVMRATGCTDIALCAALSLDTQEAVNLKAVGNSESLLGTPGTFINDLGALGTRLATLCEKFPLYNAGEIVQIAVDSALAGLSQEEATALNATLNADKFNTVMDVLLHHAAAERELHVSQGTTWSKDNALGLLEDAVSRLKQGVADKLGVPYTETNYPKTHTFHDLSPVHEGMLEGLSISLFPLQITVFDSAMSQSGISDRKSYEALSKLYYELVPKETGANLQAHNLSGPWGGGQSWTQRSLAQLFSLHAKELAQLQQNGEADAQTLWELLHGGAVPRGLTKENFAALLMERIAFEVEAINNLLGRKLSLGEVVESCHKAGWQVKDYLYKMSHAADLGGVKFTLENQSGLNGPYGGITGTSAPVGTDFGLKSIADAEEAIGSTQYPGGAQLTLVGSDGSTTVLTQRELKEQDGAVERGVGKMREICKGSEASLKSLGVCIQNAAQRALNSMSGLCGNVGGDKVAFNYRISTLPDGGVQLNVSSERGALVGVDYQIRIDSAGKISWESALTVYPTPARLAELGDLKAWQEQHLKSLQEQHARPPVQQPAAQVVRQVSEQVAKQPVQQGAAPENKGPLQKHFDAVAKLNALYHPEEAASVPYVPLDQYDPKSSQMPLITSEQELEQFVLMRCKDPMVVSGASSTAGSNTDDQGTERKIFEFKGIVFRGDDRLPTRIKKNFGGFTSRNDLSVEENLKESQGIAVTKGAGATGHSGVSASTVMTGALGYISDPSSGRLYIIDTNQFNGGEGLHSYDMSKIVKENQLNVNEQSGEVKDDTGHEVNFTYAPPQAIIGYLRFRRPDILQAPGEQRPALIEQGIQNGMVWVEFNNDYRPAVQK